MTQQAETNERETVRPLTPEVVEERLRTAIDTGDTNTIDECATLLDQFDAKPKPKRELLPSALWYASIGIPTFALRPGIKHPFGSCAACRGDKTTPKCAGPDACGHDQCHGVLDATTDPERLTRWWKATPTANIGLATGHVFDVVDIDGTEGHRQRAQRWDDIFARIDADAFAKVLTPRPGGMHIYVPPTGDGNSTKIVPSVDYRGIGGYVVAPPSIIAPGGDSDPGTYQFLGTPRLDRPAAA